MNSNLLLRSTLLLAVLTLFFQKKTTACGYDYVSNCATTLDISVDGNNSGYQASVCPYLTIFNNHNFGSVNSLEITALKSTTWESCDNYVLNARLYYRIYEQTGTGGAFTVLDMTQLNTITAGSYRTKTYQEFPSLDLLAGLNAGSYYVEIYYESDVDTDNDGTADLIITKNNGGNNFRAGFVIPTGQSGSLEVELVTKTNVTCNGDSDGSATVTTTNGLAPYTYLWSNGMSGASVTGLSAGAYTVTSTDDEGSTGTLNVLISQPSPLLANVSGEDETSPSANNGSATSNPSGGTGPYTYLWSNTETTQTITDLDSGVYTVTVTDAHDCTAVGTVIISVSGSNPTNYCDSEGDFPWVDWITNVQLGDIDHASAKSMYSDFTAVSTQLNFGANYSITLNNGFSWQTYDEYWKVWIDYDRDGNFEEPEEIAFSGILLAPPLGTPEGTTTGNFTVPTTSEEGITRMRVALKRGGYATPCETIPFGEVEDYTINLVNDGPVPCNISSFVTGIICDDNGTDLDPDDDTFTFSLMVNGSGTGPTWSTVINGLSYTGSYNSPAIFGPFDISGGDLDFTIVDADDPACTTAETVTPPAPCSTVDPCSIVATTSSPACDDNGTDADPSDDTYTFSLTVTGTNTGAGWQAIIAGQTETGSYDVPVLLGPYNIADGNLAFNVIDIDDSGCTASVSVTVPAPCSNGGSGPGYCDIQSDFPWHDWMTGVALEGLDNVSAKSAYSDFTGLSASVAQGASYDIDLTSGFSWFTYDEYWKVWIDYDQDGVFTEPDELAFSSLEAAPPNGTLEYTITGNIDIPADALTGPTRMRVAMSREVAPEPCGNFDFGEVEDYTVVISTNFGGDGTNNMILDASTGLDEIQLVAMLEVAPEAGSWVLEKSADGISFDYFADGQIAENTNIATLRQMDTQPFEGANLYRLSLLDRAGNLLSEELVQQQFQSLSYFEVFPNPTSGNCQVELSKVQGLEVKISVANQLGQPVFQEIIPEADRSFHALNTEGWKDGMYLVTVLAENRRPVTKRLIISRL